MRILIIATGYAPYMFSEAICNAKLALALRQEGIEVDAITKTEHGPAYSNEWTTPWDQLQSSTTVIDYPLGSKLQRTADVLYSGLLFGGNFNHGIRWARRAYTMALKMIKSKKYDAIITRSPNDIAHLVGLKLKRKTGITWISNWNDPADPIWPEPYTHRLPAKVQKSKMKFTSMLLKEADVISFPSESLHLHFRSHFPLIKHKQTIVLPHIGLIPQHYPKTDYKAASYSKLRILHSGNMSPERNPELLFAAIAQLKQEGYDCLSLDILGVKSNYIEELIIKYNLINEVTFLGSCSYLDSIKKLHEYDLLLLLEAVLDNGIFFASKITDYIQAERAIFAVSPKIGFASEEHATGNIKYFADNTSKEDIVKELHTIIIDWKDGKINKNLKSFDKTSMYPQSVVKTLINSINAANTSTHQS